MRNSKKPTDAVIKILLAVVLLILVIWLCASRGSLVAKTCVKMPEPEETVSEFFDALIDGRYKDCDALLSNYSSLGLISSTDTPIGEQLFTLLGDSYDYTLLTGTAAPAVVSAADAPSSTDLSVLAVYSDISEEVLNDALAMNGISGKSACQAVAFTYLDISSMSDDLHQLVTEIAYGYAYEAIDINNEETASMVVRESLGIISEDIEKYYRTDIFVIEMEYVDGEWKIILDDTLYKAIIGNIA